MTSIAATRHSPGPSETHSIATQLVTNAAGSRRLLESIRQGVQHFVLASIDGRVSVRIRLAIGKSGRGRQAFLGGALIVDWTGRAIEHERNRVSLTQTELRLLSRLLNANGHRVARGTLIAAAWPRSDRVNREHSLAAFISGLRKRLAAIGLSNALITVRGEGYRLKL